MNKNLKKSPVPTLDLSKVSIESSEITKNQTIEINKEEEMASAAQKVKDAKSKEGVAANDRQKNTTAQNAPPASHN
mgnify:CR=1 FL=1